MQAGGCVELGEARGTGESLGVFGDALYMGVFGDALYMFTLSEFKAKTR